MLLTLAPHIKKTYLRLTLSICLLVSITGLAIANASAPQASPRSKTTIIRVSKSDTRSNDIQLHDQTLSGNAYIFIKPESVKKVYFFLDPTSDKYDIKKATSVQYAGNPFDFKYTASNGKANPFNTKSVKDGDHILVVLVYWKDGYVSQPKVVPFKVNNGNYETPSTTIGTTTTTRGTTTTTVGTTSTTRGTTTTTVTTTTTTTTTPPSTGPNKPGYTLRYNEEFNTDIAAGGTIPGWSHTTGGLERDLGCYTKNNVSVHGGAVHILTKAEKANCDSAHSNFTVGEIAFANRVDPAMSPSGTVRIEMRAQMPKFTVGVWPGLWTRNGDPSGIYGEADLIEQWGDEGHPGTYETTSHLRWGSSKQKASDKIRTGLPIDQTMNVYATEIDTVKNEIRYYFNDQLVSTDTSSGFDSSRWSTALRGKWNAKITMQVAKDDQWHNTIDKSKFQTTDLMVDYVRMYTKN